MAVVRFTTTIQRHVPCPIGSCGGDTLRAVLDEYFNRHPRARGYVLDDQNRLRKHMAIFIDGLQLRDRDGLSDPVSANSTIDVLQSLSGG